VRRASASLRFRDRRDRWRLDGIAAEGRRRLASEVHRSEQPANRSERDSGQQLKEESGGEPQRTTHLLVQLLEQASHVWRDVHRAFEEPRHHALLQRPYYDIHQSVDDEPHDGAGEPRRGSSHRALPGRHGRTRVLLGEVDGERPAGDHPQAATIGEVDEREGGQRADEQPAQQNGLMSAAVHRRLSVSRSIRARDG
jgi:hypothetical protein